MSVVSVTCLLTLIGLWRGLRWGYRLALPMLIINLIGDIINVIVGVERRALVVGKPKWSQTGLGPNWFVDSPQGVLSDPAMARIPDGRLYLFEPGNPKLNLYYEWETTPNGPWSVNPTSLDWPHLGHP